jgi:hypothetical protein
MITESAGRFPVREHRPPVLGRLLWQGEAKAAALPQDGIGPYLAAMAADDPLHQRQADPGTLETVS